MIDLKPSDLIVKKRWVVGNWKMNTTCEDAAPLALNIAHGLCGDRSVNVMICPPFPTLAQVEDAIKGTGILLGAQNLYPQPDGAFTGEVSAKMLLAIGCTWVILGHSERRHLLGETDGFVSQKVRFAVEAGLSVILCVGETSEEKSESQTDEVLGRQISTGLANISPQYLPKIALAYEPVWAIGSGAPEPPNLVGQTTLSMRRKVAELYGNQVAIEIDVLYGGSVKPNNAAAYFAEPGIDGALLGGASLIAKEFLEIVSAADRHGTDSFQPDEIVG